MTAGDRQQVFAILGSMVLPLLTWFAVWVIKTAKAKTEALRMPPEPKPTLPPSGSADTEGLRAQLVDARWQAEDARDAARTARQELAAEQADHQATKAALVASRAREEAQNRELLELRAEALEQRRPARLPRRVLELDERPTDPTQLKRRGDSDGSRE